MQEIENLKKQREVELERIGTAHADAEAQKKKMLQDELDRKEKYAISKIEGREARRQSNENISY